MSEFVRNVQIRFKRGSTGVFVFVLRLLTGLFLGLTLALIGEEIIGYKKLVFAGVLIFSTGAFIRVSRGWGFWSVLIFNLVCILVGLLLRMYILIAPGA